MEPPAELIAGTREDGSTIHLAETTEYRYLGLILTTTLDFSATVESKLRLMKAMSASMRYNGTINRAPLCLQLQLFKSYVMGHAGYLLPVIPITAATLARFEAVIRKHIRHVLGLPRAAPIALVLAECNLLPFSGVHTKRVTDLHESLRLSRHREVAAAQLLGVQLAADSPAGTFAATAHTLREKADQGTRRDRDADHSPAAWAPPALYREVGATAARLQRQHAVAVGYQAARFGESRHASTMPRRAHQERMAAIQAALRPPGAPPKAHVGGLYMAGVLTPQHFGDCAFATPMSAIGAGGCAILSYCNASIPRLLAVFRIRMGRVCLAHWPFAPPRVQGGAQGDQNQRVKARIKAMSAPGPCEACDSDGARGTSGDVYHLVNECTNPHLVRVRGRLIDGTGSDSLSSAMRMALCICDEVAQALYRQGKSSDFVSPLIEAAKSALDEVDWDSLDGRHVLYRLLCVTPFTASLDPDGRLPLTRCLGRLFDSAIVRPRWLRRLAVAWGRWATRRILDIAGAWRSATVAAGSAALAPDGLDDLALPPHGDAPDVPDHWVDDPVYERVDDESDEHVSDA